MATPPSAAVSGVVLHDERGSIALPTNAASNQFVVQLQKRAKVAVGAVEAQSASAASRPSTTSSNPTTTGAGPGG